MNEVKTREEWEIEADARTLARANEIMADKERHANAVKKAEQMVNDTMTHVNSLKKVAGMRASRSSASKDDLSSASRRFLESVNKARQ